MSRIVSELIVLEPNEWGHYPVRSGENTYLVDAETGECTCPDYTFRCAFHVGQLCKHARAVATAIEAALACPYCHGTGLVGLSGVIRYVLADGPSDERNLPCIVCSGTGKRTEA